MDDVAEKRVYGERTGRRASYVGGADGLVRVAVSGDRVGGFALRDDRSVRDVAAGPVGDGDNACGPVVATDGDVLAGPDLRSVDFGPAVAVGVDGEPVAAGPAGRVARLVDGDWRDLGTVADVRAIDGGLLAAAGGIFRLDGTHVGLSDALDVAAAGPYAATADGLYRLGNGWRAVREGVCRAVAAAGDRTLVATDGGLTVRDGDGDGWQVADLPVDETVVDVALGEAAYAVTADGQFLASAAGREPWRATPLGVTGVTALSVT